MKKVCLFLIVLFSLSPLVGAAVTAEEMSTEETTSVEAFAQNTTEWMIEKLKLSEEQIPEVKAINLLYAQSAQIIYDKGGSGTYIEKAIEALDDKRECSFSLILTKKQLERYKKWVEELDSQQ